METTMEIRGVYSFNVYAPGILGDNFRNVTVTAILDQESANQSIDTQAQHVAVYPYLPAGTPNNPGMYDYIKFKTQTGQTVVLGMPWIRQNTIELVDSRIIIVKIANVKANDTSRIRNALVSNGFNSLEFTVS